MLLDTLKAKRHLTEDLQIPENIADGIIETVTSTENQVVTKDYLDQKLARWALTIVLANAALLALFAFVT